MKYDRQIQMVFGGGCSLVTEPTAALTSRFYETIQVRASFFVKREPRASGKKTSFR